MANIWYSASILHLSERFLLFLRCEGVPGKAVKEHVGAKPNLEYTLTLSGQKKRRSDNCELRCHMSQKHMLYHAPWVEKHCQRQKVLRWTTLERDTERSWQLGSDRRWYYQPLEVRGTFWAPTSMLKFWLCSPKKKPPAYKCSRHHHIWWIQILVIISPFVDPFV